MFKTLVLDFSFFKFSGLIFKYLKKKIIFILYVEMLNKSEPEPF